MVDMAGSEKADESGVTGNALKEAGHINASITVFQRVMQALATTRVS